MNHRIIKRWVSLILTLMILAAAPVIIIADEPAVTDIYSSWSAFDIFMAETAYRLGNEGTYSNFRGGLTRQKFAPVYDGLAEKFGIAVDFEPVQEQITRGDVVTALYGLIAGASALSDGGAAATYFVENKLMGGRASGDYELDKICTVEEMIVFSVRVYEHLVYQAGEDSKGFFWDITGDTNHVYLLGSIHLSDGSMYPLSRAIENAFMKADSLAVEVDVLGMGESDYAYLYEIGSIPFESGRTIKDFLSPETYEMYVSVFESFQVPQATYDFMKPWFATLILQGIGTTSDPTEVQLGVDMYFLRKAYASQKTIIELESSGFQYDLYNSLSPEVQERQLFEALSSFISPSQSEDEETGDAETDHAMREAFSILLEIVKNGDEDALAVVLGVDTETEDLLDIEFTTRFFTDRNQAMAEKIVAFLSDTGEDGAGSGDYFVVAGAGHMLGRNGIVSLLAGKGYTIERIK